MLLKSLLLLKKSMTELIKSINSLISNLIGPDLERVRKFCEALHHAAASFKLYTFSFIFNSCINQICFLIFEKSNTCPVHKKCYEQTTNNYRPELLLPISVKVYLVSRFACNTTIIVDASLNPPVSNVKLL